MDLNLLPAATAGAGNVSGADFAFDLVDDVSPGSSSGLHWRRLRARRQFRSSAPSFRQRSNFHPALEGKVEVIEVEETEEEKSKKTASFECNICFDMANEPVVTSCGHLFCWPCLYRWLHVHSHYKECPVCKGEVAENNVIPIYGRGTSGDDNNGEPNGENDEDFNFPDLNIPPRPRGNRVERLWSSGGRLDGHSERILNGWSRRSLIRRNLTELERIAIERRNSDRNNVNNNDTLINPFGDGSLPLHDGYEDQWNRFNLDGTATDRLDFLNVDLGRLVGRSANTSNRQLPSAQASLLLTGLTEGGDQAPTSSTMAVIEEDSAVTGGSPNPSSAGSSRPIRRGRSSNMSSVDVDGGGICGHKLDVSGRLVGRFANTSNRQLPSRQARLLSAGLAEGEDQAPASSTMAVIEEDIEVTGGSPDPNTAGSSRPVRSSSNLGSVDVDGGGIRGHKLDVNYRLVGRFANNSNRQLPSRQASWLPTGATEGEDQAPASSTMAVIEEDSAATGGSPDLNSARSSIPVRRARSSSSGSDGGRIRGHKLRRMN